MKNTLLALIAFAAGVAIVGPAQRILTPAPAIAEPTPDVAVMPALVAVEAEPTVREIKLARLATMDVDCANDADPGLDLDGDGYVSMAEHAEICVIPAE